MSVIDQFNVVCTNAGQAYPLSATDLVLRGFKIVAKTSNTDYIARGRANVTTTTGVPLFKGDTEVFPARPGGYNVQHLYVVAVVAGEAVTVIPD